MITRELVTQINYLARKQRYEGLTEEEKNQQQMLRRQYLDSIRQQIIEAMEGAGYTRTNTGHQHGEHCNCSSCNQEIGNE